MGYPTSAGLKMRAAVENDLGVSAKRVVKKAQAAGWWVVGVWSTGRGEDEGRAVLSLRGRRGAGRFVVLFIDGGFDAAWWWTTEHSATIKGYHRRDVWTRAKHGHNLEPRLEHDPELDEVATWTSPQPTREKLGSLSELVGVAGGRNPRPGLLETPRLVA